MGFLASIIADARPRNKSDPSGSDINLTPDHMGDRSASMLNTPMLSDGLNQLPAVESQNTAAPATSVNTNSSKSLVLPQIDSAGPDGEQKTTANTERNDPSISTTTSIELVQNIPMFTPTSAAQERIAKKNSAPDQPQLKPTQQSESMLSHPAALSRAEQTFTKSGLSQGNPSAQKASRNKPEEAKGEMNSANYVPVSKDNSPSLESSRQVEHLPKSSSEQPNSEEVAITKMDSVSHGEKRLAIGQPSYGSTNAPDAHLTQATGLGSTRSKNDTGKLSSDSAARFTSPVTMTLPGPEENRLRSMNDQGQAKEEPKPITATVPDVHIGQIDVIVEAPAPVAAKIVSPATHDSFSSRHYLRRLT